MYNPRQSRLPPRVIADRIFLRGNLDKMKQMTQSPNMECELSEGDFDLLESGDSDEEQESEKCYIRERCVLYFHFV